MSDAIAIAASGLKTESFHLESIANDLANLNTNNYKATRLQFEDVLYQSITNDKSLTKQAPTIGLGTAIHHTTKDFSPGSLKPTTNWNDLGINGLGFFQVILPDGRVAYTRSSSLSLDNEHYLCTAEGLRLYDAIQVPEDFVKLTIQKNGEVEVMLPNEQLPESIGHIRLARFMNNEQLSPIGNGTYLETSNAGQPWVDSPGQSGLGELIQGTVEASNVDVVDMLMQLTLAQRSYQLSVKTLQLADELEKETNEVRS